MQCNMSKEHFSANILLNEKWAGQQVLLNVNSSKTTQIVNLLNCVNNETLSCSQNSEGVVTRAELKVPIILWSGREKWPQPEEFKKETASTWKWTGLGHFIRLQEREALEITWWCSSHSINKKLHSYLKPKRKVSNPDSCKEKHGNGKVINADTCRQPKQCLKCQLPDLVGMGLSPWLGKNSVEVCKSKPSKGVGEQHQGILVTSLVHPVLGRVWNVCCFTGSRNSWGQKGTWFLLIQVWIWSFSERLQM